MPVLMAGTVRVYKSFASGRELLLYHLEPGQSCIASVACLFGGAVHNTRAVAQTDVTFKLISPADFDAALAEPEFRRFVMHQFTERLTHLMVLVDALYTHRVDQRLAARLLDCGGDCAFTHQQLADDLGSVREIVTRVLRHFADEGWVGLERGHVRVLAPEALRQFSQQGD